MRSRVDLRRLVSVLAFILASILFATVLANARVASAQRYDSQVTTYDVRLQFADVHAALAAGEQGKLGQGVPPGTVATGSSAALPRFGVAADSAPELASGLERTGSALAKSDPFHRSVSWVVDNPAAQRFAIKGGDGVIRELYQIPGEVNGKSGVFEWIIDRSGSNPVVNHQRFIPGGSVTGFPNQVAP
jgi:hypothetical protein